MNLNWRYDISINHVLTWFFAAMVFFGTLSCKNPEDTSQTSVRIPMIVPAPQKLLERDGLFVLDKNVQLAADFSDPQQQKLIAFAVEKLKKHTGTIFKAIDRYRNDSKSKHITFILEQQKDNSQKYELLIEPSIITIKASSINGLFYGFQTLVQLIQKQPNQNSIKIPSLFISDYPEILYRAVLIKDIEVDLNNLEHGFDMLASLKINVLFIGVDYLSELDSIQQSRLLTQAEYYHLSIVPYVSDINNSLSQFQKLTDTGKESFPIISTNWENVNELTKVKSSSESIWGIIEYSSNQENTEHKSKDNNVVGLFKIIIPDSLNSVDFQTNKTKTIDNYQGLVLDMASLQLKELSAVELLANLGWSGPLDWGDEPKEKTN